MQLPIPDDWDGETFQCVQLDWPDSPKYRSLLLGFISYMTRPRVWDETTGSIPDARAIGWQVWDRNYPLRDCAGAPILPAPTPQVCGLSFGCDEEDEEMACGITDLKFEDGKLWMLKTGCCDWTEVTGGTLAAAMADEPLPDDVFNDPDTGEPPPEGFSACGKAWSVVDALFTLIDACWDAVDDSLWSVVPHVRARLPGVNLNAFGIMNCVAGAAILDQLNAPNPADDEILRQDLICRWALLFEDDMGGVTQDIYLQMGGVDLFLMALDYHPVVIALVHDALWTIGKGDLSTIAKSGATTYDKDCTCPGHTTITPPPFPGAENIYEVTNQMEITFAECPYGSPEKLFHAEAVPLGHIRGYGQTTTNPNQSCDLGTFDEPGIEVLAGDQIWALTSVYEHGPATDFKLELGFTQHRAGGDYEFLREIGGPNDDSEALPGSWTRIGTFTGDPATLTRVYGGFHWYADGEDLDLTITRLLIRRPA